MSNPFSDTENIYGRALEAAREVNPEVLPEIVFSKVKSYLTAIRNDRVEDAVRGVVRDWIGLEEADMPIICTARTD